MTRWRVAIVPAFLAAAAVAFAINSEGSATTYGSSSPGPSGGDGRGTVDEVSPYPAPAFSGPDILSHRSVSLAGLRGKAVLVEFWESWCEPCRGALVSLEKAARAQPAGVAFVSIDVSDRTASARAVLRRAGVTFASIADPSGATAARYRVAGTPTFVLIAQDGRVHAQATGPMTARALLRFARITVS